MFEYHRAGHAHMRYSTRLMTALARVAPDRSLTLLVSVDGADAATVIPGVAIDRAIQVPHPLGQYRSRLAGILDRCAHWGHTDRQIFAWLRAHSGIGLVHYQDWHGLPTALGLAALRRLGVRSVLTVHNVRPHAFRWWQPALVKDLIDRFVFPRFDALLVHSEGLKHLLSGFIGRNAPPIYVVPHGVGETLSPGPPAPLDERLSRRQLIFVGVPRPNKGLPLLLEALDFLPDFSLTIAGFELDSSGAARRLDALIAACESKGHRITVRRGFVPDLELDGLLRTHSVVMLPYRADFRAQSGVLSQAIAYRVPVVSTDAGAVGDTVRSFNIGCVAPSPSARSLAEAVLRLYRMPPRELETNLDAAAKTLDWNRVAYTLSEAYDNICR